MTPLERMIDHNSGQFGARTVHIANSERSRRFSAFPFFPRLPHFASSLTQSLCPLLAFADRSTRDILYNLQME